jgi:hypothetical protein
LCQPGFSQFNSRERLLPTGWKSLTIEETFLKLKELAFPSKFDLEHYQLAVLQHVVKNLIDSWKDMR